MQTIQIKFNCSAVDAFWENWPTFDQSEASIYGGIVIRWNTQIESEDNQKPDSHFQALCDRYWNGTMKRA